MHLPMCFGSPNLLVLQPAAHKRENRATGSKQTSAHDESTDHTQTKKYKFNIEGTWAKLGFRMSGLLGVRKIRMVRLVEQKRNQSHTLIFRRAFALLNCLIISSSLLPESMQVESACTNSTFVSQARQHQHVFASSCGKI